MAFWLAAVVSMLIVKPRAVAEEQALLSYTNPLPRVDSMTLWDAPRAASSVAVEITLDLKALSEIWNGDFDFSSFFHHAKKDDGHGSSSRATVHAGVGQYFPDQTVVALATNGAGFEDLHWIYIKLCLTF